jgi:hypothetical protein
MLIPVIPTAAGVLLGAYATQIGVFMKNSREDKCVLKRVLFHQLNLWLELWRSDFGLLISLFIEELGAALRRLGAAPEQIVGLPDSLRRTSTQPGSPSAHSRTGSGAPGLRSSSHTARGTITWP